MKKISSELFLEINDTNFIFFAGENDQQGNFNITFKFETPLVGFENNRITDFEKVNEIIKEKIFLIEQKLNYTFKEIILIIENFDPTFLNITGFKKLNGSQILRENIIYIINILKSYVDKNESKTTILHIFNSKFFLDNKYIENLPIGLFGDFYSHELSFVLININDHKNLENILKKNNLKIKKILLKSFIKGAYLSNKNLNTETFFQIKIGKNKSKIIYFENNSLKFEQEFKFGSDIIIKDVSKITNLETTTVKNLFEKIEFSEIKSSDELIEKDFFINNDFRKIRKKLIYDISLARIQEIIALMIFENVNIKYYSKFPKPVFLEIYNKSKLQSVSKIFKDVLLKKGLSKIEIIDYISSENMLHTANQLVHFGWKKEAIPVTHSKKSLIARFFDVIFE